MNDKKFIKMADEFQSTINSYHSLVKIEKRTDCDDDEKDSHIITFDATITGEGTDPFLKADSNFNITNFFIDTCNSLAKKLFKLKLNWNNTRTIFWIYNEKK